MLQGVVSIGAMISFFGTSAVADTADRQYRLQTVACCTTKKSYAHLSGQELFREVGKHTRPANLHLARSYEAMGKLL